MRAIMVALLLTLSGCCTEPDKETLAAAEIGERPSAAQVESDVRVWLKAYLKDYESAKIDQSDYVPVRYYYCSNGDFGRRIAWSLPLSINAKNGYGGYTGLHTYVFYWKNGSLVKVLS